METKETNFFWKNIFYLTKELILVLLICVLYTCIELFERYVLGIDLIKEFGALKAGSYNLLEIAFGATLTIVLQYFIKKFK